ncbi:MAG: glycogen-binding domain-containing protein [Candidatus Omnitrophota bacterium]
MSIVTSKIRTTTNERAVEFRLFAPQAKSVNVCGTFNEWRTNAGRMTKDNSGVWKGSVSLRPGKYEYRFFVDGQWIDDPRAQKTVANKFGSRNAVLEVK